MRNLNTYRDCVAMKNGRKILNMTVGSYTFLGILLIPLFFIVFGIIAVITATKRVEVAR